MALFGKQKNGALSVNFMMIDGVSTIPRGMAVSLTLLEDKVEIKQRIGKNQPAYLSYNQITAVGMVNEKEVKETDKSVLGRAAVGGLLLGPLGAVVGGMSGIGTKKKELDKEYFVINYISTSNNQTSAISFEIVGATIGFEPFLVKLKELAGIVDTLVQEGAIIL